MFVRESGLTCQSRRRPPLVARLFFTLKREKPAMRMPIDTNEIPLAHRASWFAQTLISHNGVNLKFRVMRETCAEFHVHASSPECFFVVSGSVTIDTESNSVTLGPGQFLEVPAGTRHRSRVEGEATVLVLDGLAP
jgi:mannose-6-phosphate isomerase-like protein (cupin superfamily)